MNRKVSRRIMLGALTSAGLAGIGLERPVSSFAQQLKPLRSWRTWLIESQDEFRPAAPGPVMSAEIEELIALQQERNDNVDALVTRWVGQPAVFPWTELSLDLIITYQPSPVHAGRELSLLQTAMFDAVMAASDSQLAYPRPYPSSLDSRVEPMLDVPDDDSAFPSSAAAVAGAASGVLSYLFPEYPASSLDAIQEEATSAIFWSGLHVRSDIEAGIELGRAVAQRAIEWGESDGSDVVWDGSTRPTGAGFWRPTPPAFIQEPLDPLAGTWRTWVLPAADSIRPEAPPAYGSALWTAELAAVQEAVANRTSHQIESVHYWGGGPGTETPAGIWTGIAMDYLRRDSLDLAESARILSNLSVAMYDAFLCCWDAKYTYWYARPVTADPAIDTLIATPPFPSYTSGHSTISAAAGTVLASMFPEDSETMTALALDAKDSRLWSGIHFPIDNDMGAIGGTQIGRLVLERARVDEIEK